jgi:hypothetical protein
MVTTRTAPSSPGCRSWMHPSLHSRGGTLSSFMTTILPGLMSDDLGGEGGGGDQKMTECECLL